MEEFDWGAAYLGYDTDDGRNHVCNSGDDEIDTATDSGNNASLKSG